MEKEKKQDAQRESGEYDLAEPAPLAPPPASSMPDPRLADAEPATARPDLDTAPPRAETSPSEPQLSGFRPDLDLNEKAKTVRMHLPCARCGQDLKGQPRDGECPSCGFDVALSLQGDRLDFANPQWIARLRAGARQLLLAAILYAAAMVILISVHQVLVVSTLLIVGAVFDLLGIVSLTAHEPLMYAGKKGLSPSPLIRLLALLAGAGGVAVGLSVFWDAMPAGLFTGLSMLALAALAARSIPLGYAMQALIKRIPNDSAATEWMIFGWLLAGASLFVAVVYVPMRNEFSGPWGIFHLFAITPALAAAVWYLKITRTLASDLGQSLYEALKPKKKKT